MYAPTTMRHSFSTAIVCLITATGIFPKSRVSPPRKKPNIILVLCDVVVDHDNVCQDGSGDALLMTGVLQ